MSKTAFFTDDLFLEHDTGPQHPETSGRLVAIREKVERQTYFNKFVFLERRFASVADVALMHEERYINNLKVFGDNSGGYLDGDTPVSARSYEAALLAAGAGIEAAERMQAGEINRALLLLRPPGHHSLRTGAMGFCLFNNVAICAKNLLNQGRQKIAILDWDVHHGNGTQAMFYENPDVLFISMHQFPFYPGSGAAQETGAGAGRGYTLNLPMAAGSGDAEYISAFREKVLPALEAFQPEVLLISAGYDAHVRDPLASIQLTTETYAWMTKQSLEFAEQHCGGRIISFLEGGYDFQALADSVEAHAAVLI